MADGAALGSGNAYEEQRARHIARNMEFMKRLGLAPTHLPGTPKADEKAKPAHATPAKRRRAQPAEPARRSLRTRGKLPEMTPEETDAAADVDAEDDQDYQDEPRRRPRTSRPRVFTPISASKASVLRKLDASSAVEAFMNDARAHGEWFSNAVVSASNSSRVMARVQALVSGEGIRHPVTGAVFARGRKVSLGDDLEELFLQACAFEDTHGEDKGNGWLLRHPIKKIISVQQHVIGGGKIAGFEVPEM